MCVCVWRGTDQFWSCNFKFKVPNSNRHQTWGDWSELIWFSLLICHKKISMFPLSLTLTESGNKESSCIGVVLGRNPEMRHQNQRKQKNCVDPILAYLNEAFVKIHFHPKSQHAGRAMLWLLVEDIRAVQLADANHQDCLSIEESRFKSLYWRTSSPCS